MNVGCEGKERFLTFALAERIAGMRRREGTKRMAYKCDNCGGYHIGSTTEPKSVRYDGRSPVSMR